MAKSNAYLIPILLIMASLSSPSQGLSLGSVNITRVIIEGVVRCNLNGQQNPVDDATVFLTCGGSTISLAEAVTNTQGAYRIVLNILQTVVFNPSYCGIGVNLPTGGCAFILPENVANNTVLLTLVQVLQNTATYVANIILGS